MNKLYKIYLYLRQNARAALKALFRFFIPLKLKLKPEAITLLAISKPRATTINLGAVNLNASANSFLLDTTSVNILLINDVNLSINGFLTYSTDYLSSLIDFGVPIESNIKLDTFNISSFYANTTLDTTIVELPINLQTPGVDSFSLLAEIDNAIDISSNLSTYSIIAANPYLVIETITAVTASINQVYSSSFASTVEINGAIDSIANISQFYSLQTYLWTEIDSTVDLVTNLKQYLPVDFITDTLIGGSIDISTLIDTYALTTFLPDIIINSAIDTELLLSQYLPISFIPNVDIDSAVNSTVNLSQFYPIQLSSKTEIDRAINANAFISQLYPVYTIPNIGINSAIVTTTDLESYLIDYISNISGISSVLDLSVTNMQLKPIGGDIFSIYVPIDDSFLTSAIVNANLKYSNMFYTDITAAGKVSFAISPNIIAATSNIFYWPLDINGKVPFEATALDTITDYITSTFTFKGAVNVLSDIDSYLVINTIPNIQILGTLDVCSNIDTFDGLFTNPEIEIGSSIDFTPNIYSFATSEVFANTNISQAVNITNILDSYNTKYSSILTGIDGGIEPTVEDFTLLPANLFNATIYDNAAVLLNSTNTLASVAIPTNSTILANGIFDLHATLGAILAPPIDLGYTNIGCNTYIDFNSISASNTSTFIANKVLVDDSFYLNLNTYSNYAEMLRPVIFSENIELADKFKLDNKLADISNFKITDTDTAIKASFCYTIYAKLYDYQSDIYTLGSMEDKTLMELSFTRHSY